jgi:hypothetical protein
MNSLHLHLDSLERGLGGLEAFLKLLTSDVALNTSESQEETYNSSGKKWGDASLTPNRTDSVRGASSPQAHRWWSASHGPWMKRRGRKASAENPLVRARVAKDSDAPWKP